MACLVLFSFNKPVGQQPGGRGCGHTAMFPRTCCRERERQPAPSGPCADPGRGGGLGLRRVAQVLLAGRELFGEHSFGEDPLGLLLGDGWEHHHAVPVLARDVESAKFNLAAKSEARNPLWQSSYGLRRTAKHPSLLAPLRNCFPG